MTKLWSGRGGAEEEFGPVGLASEAFAFNDTAYYEPTMGLGLKKQFLAFEHLIDAARLPAIKRQTNAWEEEYATTAAHAERRPLNLDPGYLSLAKLVLASSKDHAHRIYLSDGVYAEITLRYHQKAWQPWDWTFPDYRRADYQRFFDRCRQYLRSRRSADS